MADVGFDRAHGAEAPLLGALAEGLGQRGDLNRVAEGGAGAVGFDITDCRRCDPGVGLGGENHLALPFNAGRCVTNFARAIVVDGRPFDHGVDGIAISQGVGEPFEQHHPRTIPGSGALRLCIKGATMTVRREDHPFFIEVALRLLGMDGDAARQRHLTFATQQTLRRYMHCHQTGGTGRIDRQAGAGQIELVGDVGGHGVPLVAHGNLIVAQRAGDLGIAGQVEGTVAVETGTSKDANSPPNLRLVGVGRITGLFQRFPGTLGKEAMLGIGGGGFTGAVAKEGGVKVVNGRQPPHAFDIVRVLHQRRIYPRRQQFFIRDGQQ